MAYAQIDISPAGMAEIPLLRVLHESTTGGNFGSIQGLLEAVSDPYLLIAHLEGNPLGHLIAIADGGSLIVHSLGVLATYQRTGIASRLLALAKGEAKMRGLVELRIPTPTPESTALARALGFVASPDGRAYWLKVQ